MKSEGADTSDTDSRSIDLDQRDSHSIRLTFDRALSDEAEKLDRSLFCNFYEIYRCV